MNLLDSAGHSRLAAGNMTSDGTTTWAYGGNNRPVSAGPATFLFNALGQRLRKASAGHALRLRRGRAPVGRVHRCRGAHPGNHPGTPRMVTRSSDNQVVWRWDNREPFGDSAPDENPGGLGVFAFNLRFPGQYWDVETGTSYNMARDYDARIGRYIQSDPIGLRGGPNTYNYVDASPLTQSDPTGEIAQAAGRAAWAIGSGIGGAINAGLGLALGTSLGSALYDGCRKDDCKQHLTDCLTSGWGGKVGFDSACFACFERCRGTGKWPDSVTSGLRGQFPVSCEYWLKVPR